MCCGCSSASCLTRSWSPRCELIAHSYCAKQSHSCISPLWYNMMTRSDEAHLVETQCTSGSAVLGLIGEPLIVGRMGMRVYEGG